MTTLPSVSRTYRSWGLDSTRWLHARLRDDDVVVTTPYKSGTTWMLQIAGQIIFNDLKLRPHREFGRWIDAAFAPIEEVAEIDDMPHRRVLKSHLPLDGLPYHAGIRYIYVGRDLRDIFMSLWNHHMHYTPELWARMAATAERFGAHMPDPPGDIHDFWRDWTTRGYFEWEKDGYPYWSATAHLKSWWDFRHLPNILFVHFNDLLSELPGEVARVADFIGVPLDATRAAEIAEIITFRSMKQAAEVVSPGANFLFRGGAQTFFNKGTNGRWRDTLTDDDLALYRPLMQRLPADAARWMEEGAVALRDLERAG
jgi:aryl sulfotransferase